MFAAINAWTLSSSDSAERQMRAAVEAGFRGIELVVDETGPLTLATTPAEFMRLAERARELDIRVIGLATGLFWQHNYASPDPADRGRARDITLTLLDQAAAARVQTVLVVPAIVGRAGDAAPAVAYTAALSRSLDALSALRFEAETRGVTLAIENVWNRFLLSPVEAAELIDRVGSPNVRFYLDTGNVMPFGYPEDWIATLGARIVRIHLKDYDLRKPGGEGFCALGEGSVRWPAVMQALRAMHYTGPLTYEGPGEPAEVCGRIQAILGADAPVRTLSPSDPQEPARGAWASGPQECLPPAERPPAARLEKP